MSVVHLAGDKSLDAAQCAGQNMNSLFGKQHHSHRYHENWAPVQGFSICKFNICVKTGGKVQKHSCLGIQRLLTLFSHLGILHFWFYTVAQVWRFDLPFALCETLKTVV